MEGSTAVHSSIELDEVRTGATASSPATAHEEEEIEQQWEAIKRLPLSQQLKTSLLDCNINGEGSNNPKRRAEDVTKLSAEERRWLLEKLIKNINTDHPALH